LCKRFRYLIFWWHGKNLCIVCTHLSLLYTAAITLHLTWMIFTLMIISTFDSCHCRDSCTHFNENPSSDPILWDLDIMRNLSDKCNWSYSSYYCWIISGYSLSSSSSLRNIFFLMILFENPPFRYLSMLCSSYGNDNFLVIFIKVKFVIWWVYIRYHTGFKVCQIELVIAITQIYGWKIAYGKNAILAGQQYIWYWV